jgi:hypothetical protein
LWTYEQLQAALPYVTSVVRSLRDQTLNVRAQRRRLESLSNRPGRPDRKMLIEMEELAKDIVKSEDELRQTTEELETLGLAPADGAKGQALAPFMHEDQLAWFVFDLFDDKRVRFWRFQTDPDDTRRRLTTAKT